MTIKFSKLQGVDPAVAQALKGAGLDSSEQLIAVASTPHERRDLSKRLGISEKILLDLVNRADIARIEGIGKIYSDLLEFAGVDTIAELSNRNHRNLHAKIKEVAEKHHVRRTPNPATVEDWVEQAKELGKSIS
ncbi:MAG: DUF4332 domain-containing protein [Chloroflexota bacterium]